MKFILLIFITFIIFGWAREAFPMTGKLHNECLKQANYAHSEKEMNQSWKYLKSLLSKIILNLYLRIRENG